MRSQWRARRVAVASENMTMEFLGEPSRSARHASESSRKTQKAILRKGYLTAEGRVAQLVACVSPLLELFADIDSVFTEDDALDPTKRQMSLGRCYRSWKQCRTLLDPEFAPERDTRDRRGRATATLLLDDGTVLQPRRRRPQRAR